MSSPEITTVVQMMESLPENVQGQVLEHLREYIQDLQDELQWDEAFKRTESKLVEAARKAKQEMAQGLAESMNLV